MRAALERDGVLLRNDAAIRRHEGFPLEVVPADGVVPETIEVAEHGVRYLAAPRTGQKTGAFLDQREDRVLVAGATRPGGGGRALDAFAYHGSFALHLARRVAEVVAVDSSAEALERGRANAALNGVGNITFREANAFDLLRELERRAESLDGEELDPPAVADTNKSGPSERGGVYEWNIRPISLLRPGWVPIHPGRSSAHALEQR